MTAIQIETIERHVEVSGGFALDEPREGTAGLGWGIGFAGWLAELYGIIRIEDGHGTTLAKCAPAIMREGMPEGVKGYFLSFSALELECTFELRVVGERRDTGEDVPLATLRGTRDALPLQSDARFSPIVLNCLGRVGSTWISALLDQHPELLAYRPFEFETRTASYWVEVFRALSRPRSYFQVFASDLRNPLWWAGETDPGSIRSLPDHSVLEAMGGPGVVNLANHAASQIEAFYQSVADEQEKPASRFFVEKTGHPFVARVLDEMYEGSREVFLVRDFRDMFTSMRSHFRQIHGDGTTPDDDLLANLDRELRVYVQQWETRGHRGRLLRYEDLIGDPIPTLTSLFGWLGVEDTEAVAEKVIAGATAARPDLQAEHRTTSSPKASVGRWRRDLPPELADRCNDVLGGFAETFGY